MRCNDILGDRLPFGVVPFGRLLGDNVHAACLKGATAALGASLDR